MRNEKSYKYQKPKIVIFLFLSLDQPFNPKKKTKRSYREYSIQLTQFQDQFKVPFGNYKCCAESCEDATSYRSLLTGCFANPPAKAMQSGSRSFYWRAIEDETTRASK